MTADVRGRQEQLRRSPSTGSLELNLQQQRPQGKEEKFERRDHVFYFSSLFAGVGSGALSSLICAPLDLIRTRMQVWGEVQLEQKQRSSAHHHEGSNSSSVRHRNTSKPITPAEAFRAILQKEGPRGMFRGLGATLVTVPLFWGVYFPLYDETKHCLQTSSIPKDVFRIDLVNDYHPGFIHCLSAIFTGAIADVICNPFFVVRTRLQTQALHELTTSNSEGSTTLRLKASSNRISMPQMARSLYIKHGLPVFWRGMTANLIGLSHCAVQFPAYEFLKHNLRERRRQHSDGNISSEESTVSELLLASGLAKMTASLLSYPHEVLRSRMVDSRSSISPTLSGTMKQIFRNEGILGFYNGLGVTLLRVIPNCCVTFLSYELLRKHSKEYFSNR